MYLPKPTPRPRLAPGQRRRSYLRRRGKVARANEKFRIQMLSRWFHDGMAECLKLNQKPITYSDGTEWIRVWRQHMPGEGHFGFISRRFIRAGLVRYKGHGIVVGHLPSRTKCRRPEDRNNPEAVVPMSPALNKWMNDNPGKERP